MNIRLAELERALENPVGYLREKANPPKAYHNRYLALRASALDFHKTGDLTTTMAALENRLLKGFKTTKGTAEYLRKLKEYADEFEALGTTFVRARNNIRLSLPQGYAKRFSITGQIARLDIHHGHGYRAWVFASRTKIWKNELRFPLMQLACAKQLNVDISEVIPGVYDFSCGRYTECIYTKRELNLARERLLKLLDKIGQYQP